MIIGTGDIASVLGPFDRPGWVFFASGVSNSQETREGRFEREKDLLRSYGNQAVHAVYFSTLSIFYADTRYTRHKREMEHLVKMHFGTSTIIRIGNITWGKNPHTLINFLRNQLAKGEEPVLQNVDRFIVDEEEFLYWIAMIPEFSCEINVPGQRMKVKEVWKRYVGHRADLEVTHA